MSVNTIMLYHVLHTNSLETRRAQKKSECLINIELPHRRAYLQSFTGETLQAGCVLSLLLRGFVPNYCGTKTLCNLLCARADRENCEKEGS